MLDITAEKVMTSPVVSIKVDAPLSDVVKMLHRHYISGLTVLDEEGRVAGIISEKDLIKYTRLVVGRPLRDPGMFLGQRDEIASVSGERGVDIVEAVAAAKAGQVMSDKPLTAKRETPLLEIVRLMNRYGINRVPVVDDEGRPEGIVSRADILKEVEKWAERA